VQYEPIVNIVTKEATMKIIQQKKVLADALPVIVLILCALAIRVLLMAWGWPSLDSDEGIVGLQAIHIAYLGEHPTFLYGQEYMGTIQPYLASFFFRLFGTSAFTLQLTTLTLFGCFLFFMYLLTRLLYTHKMALFVLLLLALGTQYMLTPQIMVEGGVVETLLFAAVLILLATWLALTYRNAHLARWRLVAYTFWGLTAGAALWSDYLISPWLLGTSLLLLIFCWREWRKAGFICLIIGFIIGALPIIIYNFHPLPGENFFQVIWSIEHPSSPGTVVDALVRWKELSGTFLYGVPMMSGLVPLCTINDLPAFAPIGTHVALCALLNGSWSVGYIVLIVLAAVPGVRTLRKLRRLYRAQPDAWSPEKQRAAILHAARLILVLAVTLTLALYALSPTSGLRPWSTRYLTCLLVATPALLAPLWGVNSSIPLLSQRLGGFLGILRRAFIALILLSLLASTAMLAQVVPAAVAYNQSEHQLISDLLSKHITRVYSEYWTCGRIMFQSREKIICAVVDFDAVVQHNRYMPYVGTVEADPDAPYIFPLGDAYALYVKNFTKELVHSPVKYQRSVFDNYVVFIPV
jgi:hypothetical protein